MTDTDYVKQRLESAGKTLTMLTTAGIFPKGYFSSMPEYARELGDLLEYDPVARTYTVRIDRSREFTRRPTAQEITEYEEVEGWLTSLALYCHRQGFPWVSKAVQFGLPRCPRSGRAKKSLRSVAKILQTNKDYVSQWQRQGEEILSLRIVGKPPMRISTKIVIDRCAGIV